MSATKYTLDDSNDARKATVDDKQLRKGDTEGIELTKAQVERLAQADITVSEVNSTTNR
jgi:hypothetical protein